MKLKIILLFSLCLAMVLGGCSYLNEPTGLVVTANKLAAHPPETITIRADPLNGWSFAFDTDVRTFRTGTNEVEITFYELPAVVKVTATRAGEIDRHGEVFIDLINEPVNMDDRPFVASYGHVQGGTLPNTFGSAVSPFDAVISTKHQSPSGDYFLSPLSYEVFLCERDAGEAFWPGDIPLDWGFYDPEGDEWHIVEVVAWYVAAGESDADAVFASVPYKGDGFYEFKGHDNAFLIIPSWPQIIDTETHILKAPVGGVPGYPSVGYCYSCSANNYPEQDYFVKITTEDCFGARNTKTFVYRMLPTGCW